jgi:hypothetical protein
LGNGQNGTVPPTPNPATANRNHVFTNAEFDSAKWYAGTDAAFNLSLTLVRNHDRLNLYQYVRDNSVWNGQKPLNLTLTIPSDVTVYSSDFGTSSTRALPNGRTTTVVGPSAALVICYNNGGTLGTATQNGFPTGVTTIKIINNGLIVGAHGIGGAGGIASTNCTAGGSGTAVATSANGNSGTPGGTAIYTEVPITIDNNNYILAGGGGGGGGAGMNITARVKQTVTTTTYSQTDAQCIKRCGQATCYGACGGGQTSCYSCSVNRGCNPPYCGGLGCQSGITCYGNYFTWNWFNSSTHSYSPCWGGCRTRTSTATEVVNGTTFKGKGTLGGLSYGSGGSLDITFADRAKTGPWTFKTYGWFSKWYDDLVPAGSGLVPASNNLNNNILSNDVNIITPDGTNIAAELFRPSYKVNAPANDSDGGNGTGWGSTGEAGYQYYTFSGQRTGCFGAGGAGGRKGYTTDGTGAVTMNNYATITEFYYFGGERSYS